MRPFEDPDVAEIFDGYPRHLRKRLLELRELVFDVAACTPSVGRIEESLKWGQPAYLTRAPRSGTTIRIAPARGGPDRYALYVHCQSKLIPTIKRLYASTFRYEKNRALVFETGKPVPLKALSHCIELALTYHLDEKAAKRLDPSPQ